MTLREYLVKGYKGDVSEIFTVARKDEETKTIQELNIDNVAMFAESLTVEEFCQMVNIDSLSIFPKSDVIQMFKNFARENCETIQYEALPELIEADRKTFDHPYAVVNNGVLKKKLIYNDNYEPASDDDYD